MSARQVLLFIVPILVTSLAIEFVFRFGGLWVRMGDHVFDHFAPSEIPGVPFTYKPNLDKLWAGINIKTNSMGLKDPWEPDQIRQDCRRIVVLGGSFTAGFGVDTDKSFARQLENILNAREDQCHQVFNAGHVSYSTQDIAALMKHLVGVYKPDLIVHFVNRFAMNDTSEVSENGKLRLTGVTYDWLRFVWGMRGGAYSVKHVNPSLGQSTDSLLKMSYALSYFSVKLQGWRESANSLQANCDPQSCFPTTLRYPLTDGSYDQFLNYSPLYYSPFYKKRLYHELNSAIAFLKEKNTPVMFVTLNFYIDPTLLNSQPEAIFDLSEIVEMKNDQFLSSYNLVWDFHFTSHGHQLIAEGLYKKIKSFGSASGSPFSYPLTSIEKNRALRQYDRYFQSHIDLREFNNVHQIIGGLKPNKLHDIKEVSILLKKTGHSVFSWRGRAHPGRTQKFVVELIDQNGKTAKFLAEFEEGPFHLKYPLALSDGLIDIRLTCQLESCDQTEYEFVGLE